MHTLVTKRKSFAPIIVTILGYLLTTKSSHAENLGLNVWGMEFATVNNGDIDHMAFYPGVSLSVPSLQV